MSNRKHVGMKAAITGVATLLFVTVGNLFALPTLTLTLSAPVGAGGTVCSGGTISGGMCNVSVNSSTGAVTYSGQVGEWNIVVASHGLGYPALGSPAAPVLDLSSSESSSVTNPGNLAINFSENGFTGSPLQVNTSDGGTDFGTMTSFSVSTTPASNTAALGYTSPGSTAGTSQAFAFNSPLVSINPGANYTLELATVISADGNAPYHLSSFDSELVGTPEPGLYGLLALGLSGLAYVRRAKRKHSGSPSPLV